jgi:hypothetical protein
MPKVLSSSKKRSAAAAKAASGLNPAWLKGLSMFVCAAEKRGLAANGSLSKASWKRLKKPDVRHKWHSCEA